MNRCKQCDYYNKRYDEFIASQHDCDDNADKKEKHGCIMFDDYIPHEIWNNKNECPYFSKKGDDQDGNS